ncbi:hypothetical protein UT300007_31490 [Clostridium sp. CTA-7]
MRKVCRGLLITVLLLKVVHIYPQALLINFNSNIVENPMLVDKVIKENTNFINIDVEIPQIVGLANKDKEKVINKEILDWTDMWIKDVKDVSEEFNPTIPYQLNARYTLTNDKKILSFFIDYYQFSGGAHGITTRKTYNVDISTGEKLELKDLFKKGYDYKKFINEVIQKEINKNPEYYFTGKDGFNGIKDDQSFYIDNGKIIIHFPYYEIAPYAGGMPEFEIPYEVY